MLLRSNSRESKVLSYDRLNEISIVLRTGRTVLSKVMYLILTVAGCIILKVDNRLQLREYADVFGERSLLALTSDLENLLRFDPKFFDHIVLKLVAVVIRKESNHSKRAANSNAKTSTDRCERRWYKVILRRKVRSIVKFMIFRKARRSVRFYTNDDVTDWYPYKEQVNTILQCGINQRHTLTSWQNNISVENNTKKEINCSVKVEAHGREVPAKRTWNLLSDCTNEIKSRVINKYVYVAHTCNKIYCPLCYGWLWIPLYYCCMFLYPLAVNSTCKYAHDVVLR